MGNFFENHLGEIITVCSTVGVCLITIGVFKNRIETLEHRMTAAEDNGTSYAREHIGRAVQKIEYVEHRLAAVEAQNSEMRKLVGEIHTSVRVIENTLKQQYKG